MPDRLRHILRVSAYACACASLLALTAFAASSGGATGDGPVVTMDIPSALNVSDAGCRDEDALAFGVLLPTQFAVGESCEITFGSSNGPAQLRAWQRDATGTAMQSTSGNWTQRAGAGNHYAITARPGGKAWVGGSAGLGDPAGRIHYTDSNGASWTSVDSCNTTAVVMSIQAVSDLLLYAVVGGDICISNDGGLTWSTTYVNNSTNGWSPRRIDMIDATNGYAVGENQVFQTTDGVTFNPVYTSTDLVDLMQVSATPTTVAIAARTSNTSGNSKFGVVVWHSDDSTWREVVLDESPGRDTSGTHGTLVVDDDTIILSTPRWSGSTETGGRTIGDWDLQDTSPMFEGEPFIRADGRIYATYNGFQYRYSDSSGTPGSWVLQRYDPAGTGVARAYRDMAGVGTDDTDTTLWVGAHGGYVRRSNTIPPVDDWSTVMDGKPHVRAVIAWDRQRWVLAGDRLNQILYTDNGGTDLDDVTVPIDGPWHDGLVLDGNGGGLLVGNAAIVRTTDFGENWTSIDRPHAGAHWYAVERDSDGRIWLMGAAGGVTQIAYSDTEGESWTLAGSFASFAGTRMSVWRGRIWIGGSAAQYAQSSTTLPLSWTSGTIPSRTGEVNGIWAIDENSAVFLTGYEYVHTSSVVSRTTNGGSSWTSTILGNDNFASGMAYSDDHRYGYALTSCGRLHPSMDQGVTWEEFLATGTCSYLYDAQVMGGSGRIVAVGENGQVSMRDPLMSIDDGMLGTGSGFGVCVETTTNVALAQWPVLGSGNCTAATPAASWRGVPADATDTAASYIARTDPGDYGIVDLKFGLRASSFATANSYAADIVFEAVAPEL